jgi:hypothetical protein
MKKISLWENLNKWRTIAGVTMRILPSAGKINWTINIVLLAEFEASRPTLEAGASKLKKIENSNCVLL